MAGVIVADLKGLIPVLAVAYGVVLGAVVLVTGWRLFRDREPRGRRRGVMVPPVGVIAWDDGAAR